MPARALWKGQLRLSLVSIPIELFSATRPGASVSFRQIHKPSGKPIHYQKVVEGVGPVDVDDIIEKKTAPFDANAFKDNYTAALKELVKRKMKGKSTRVTVEEGERPERRGDNVVDLMAALKKSLEGGEGKKPQAKAQSSSRRGRRKSA
ncbi:hypothetical protein EHS39_21675 [Ensifer sp. MPMI2T]|nr:hypothetical protein EHS39_21675 [Ensifer sp. MPMI2T]